MTLTKNTPDLTIEQTEMIDKLLLRVLTDDGAELVAARNVLVTKLTKLGFDVKVDVGIDAGLRSFQIWQRQVERAKDELLTAHNKIKVLQEEKGDKAQLRRLKGEVRYERNRADALEKAAVVSQKEHDNLISEARREIAQLRSELAILRTTSIERQADPAPRRIAPSSFRSSNGFGFSCFRA